MIRTILIRTLIIGAAAAMLATAAPSASAYPPSRWVCRDNPGMYGVLYRGWTDPNPYIVNISHSTVMWITRHVGTFEGRPGTAPQYVPCVVAEAVANAATHAWVYNWAPSNSGWMGAGWAGAASGPWFGSFHCLGQQIDQNKQTYQVDCFHLPDRHVGHGFIGVGFLIQPASG